MDEQIAERLLRLGDVAAALQLSTQAGWNQTEDDWHTLRDLAPESCWVIEIDGKLAATTTLICYGRRLGWIGMVLTSQEHRRRGLAKRLLTTVLAQADSIGIETLKLDATEQGRPLYEQFGFRSEQEIERWSRPGDGTQHLPLCPHSGEVWRDSDAIVFGADRSQLLRGLARRNPPVSQSQSYLFAREGRETAYLGPCVSEDSTTASSLLQQVTQNTHGGWSWDLLANNREAVVVARDLGFTAQRHLVRMARGKTLQGKDSAMYAIAGFELG
jgi:GNAT superfamily N-acetyltransferase